MLFPLSSIHCISAIFMLQVALFSFQEVINRLCHGTQGDGHSQEVTQGIVEVCRTTN